VLTGLLALLTPIVTQQLFDEAIPGAQRSVLFQLGLGLLVAAVASLLFDLARSIALLRLSGRMEAAVQSAVTDRLLDLPATFFRQYTAGDLATRCLGISNIRDTLSRVVLSSLLAGFSALISFGLLFYYDINLALVACALAAVMLLAVY